jgi:NNP family nitrate/nitrite transporter-like MFS transporter
MRAVLRIPHSWVILALYVGTFGSFIGFGFAFGQVLQVQFKADFPTPLDAAYLTFLGPLLGSLIRPVGGMLADRFGGARVTALNFVAMAGGAALVLMASLRESLPLFVVAFTTLFVLSGLGNGSTYKMIPAIFRAKSQLLIDQGEDTVTSDREARRLSGALIGIAGAIGAFGGVLVNVAFRQSFLETKAGNAAYVAFLGYYGVCVLVTYVVYLRPRSKRLVGV